MLINEFRIVIIRNKTYFLAFFLFSCYKPVFFCYLSNLFFSKACQRENNMFKLALRQ